MIWHLLELWLMALAAFAVGSVIGALVYIGLSRSALARLQGAFADRVGDMIDGIRTRFGGGPVWRPKVRRNRIRPSPQARQAGLGGEPARGGTGLRRPAFAAEIAYRGRGSGDDVVRAGRIPAPREEWTPVPLDDDDLVEAIEGDVAAAAAGFHDADEAPAIMPMRPVGLGAPRNGVPDDLQRIRGIGRRNEELLNSLGIFHFGQIAAWTPGEMRWIGTYLAFPERIERDDWVGQATVLASGGNTGYVKADRRKARDEDEA